MTLLKVKRIKIHSVGALSLIMLFFSCIEVNEKTLTTPMVKEENTDTILPKIAILGTFHFGETTDYSSMDMDDFSAPSRQKELDELVRVIERYRPTKILLECQLKEELQFQNSYEKYIANQRPLQIDEREQIGYRLAKNLGHSTIYCIDYKLSLPLDELSRFAENNKKEEFFKFLQSIEQSDERDSKILSNTTLRAYFAYKNSLGEDLKNKRQYIQETAKFVSDSTYIGVEFVSKWWERNFHIMSNIDSHMTSTDVILVLIGGAHRTVLKDFYQDRDDVTYVEIGKYLKDDPEQ
ncbi:DUF5694 domain-containing protein [uncultured Croceitalea sp.]|uniref:DUF5694 domain-containing protein n=1 Tax=uncultured Croceitalea sp. TaxID=1798908 RepID=UPI003305B226